jgi:hypothetical protein
MTTFGFKKFYFAIPEIFDTIAIMSIYLKVPGPITKSAWQTVVAVLKGLWKLKIFPRFCHTVYG